MGKRVLVTWSKTKWFYLDKIPASRIPLEFLKEGAWIAALGLLNWLIWKKGVRQYVAMLD